MDAVDALNPKAFEKRIVALLPAIRSFAVSRLGNTVDADDVTQETVMKAISHRHQFQPGTNLKAWLTTICRNEIFTRYRKRKNEVEDPDQIIADSFSDDREEDTGARSEYDRVMSMLDALDPQSRAIMLEAANGSSYDEIAERHGIALGTVKSRINRTRQILLAARNEGGAPEVEVPASLDLRPISKPVYVQEIVAPAELGSPPILRWLPVSSLRIDPKYQRDILDRGKANIAQISRNFDWSKFGTVIVAPAGSFFAIIDGQHRTTAAHLCGIEHVPCQIIEATPEEQAAAFAAINGNTTTLTPMQIFHAKLAAGDTEAIAVNKACEAAGVRILKFPVPADKIGPAQTMAVGTLRMAHKRHGAAILAVALSCLSKTRAGNPGMFRQQIITALCAVLARKPDLVADPSLAIAAAAKVKFQDIWQRANVASKQKRTSLALQLIAEFKEVFK